MTEQERPPEGAEGAGDSAPSAAEVGGTQPQAGGPAAADPSAAPPPEGATPEAIAAKGEPTTESKPERPAKAAEAKTPTKEPPAPGGIADLIKAALPELAFEAYQGMSDVIVEISPADVPATMPVLKDDPSLDLKLLRCLSGVDHEAEGMEVVYHLMSLTKPHEVTIKAKLPLENLHIPSVASVWSAADWHEREARDMFGIEFDGHPHLVPLLLPEDMTDYFPLRKDNPLAEIDEWQGELLGDHMAEAGHIPSGSKYEGVGSKSGGDEE
jgi:NADH-quinone oxidoreductase subunit C